MGKWVFKHKFHANGSLERYKAHWVCVGFTQQPGIHHGEMFSPVVKATIVCNVLPLSVPRDWLVHQPNI
jgi:hypothetical protein